MLRQPSERKGDRLPIVGINPEVDAIRVALGVDPEHFLVGIHPEADVVSDQIGRFHP